VGTCILITGLHRSGTSVTANIVSKLGVTFDTDLLEPDDYNPTGYFESHWMNQELGELIKSYGTSKWLPPETPVGAKLIGHLTSKIQNGNDYYGIKDPRLFQCSAPIIRTLLDIGVHPMLITTKRSKLAVAKSLSQYPQNDPERSAAMVRKFTPMLKKSRSYAKRMDVPMLEVIYENLLKNPEREVARIGKFLPGWRSTSPRLLAEAMQVVDPSLNRSGR